VEAHGAAARDTTADKIELAGAVVAALGCFLRWGRGSVVLLGSVSVTGLGARVGWIVLAAALFLIVRAARNLSSASSQWWGGGLAAVIVIAVVCVGAFVRLRQLMRDVGDFDAIVTVRPGLGLYLVVLGAAAVIVGLALERAASPAR
jgi:hypothetical protein